MPAGAEEVVVPALLRAARGAYADAVRARLAGAGFADLPSNGPYILGGLAGRARSAGDLVRELGISKQAASQLIDALVLRGYLERAVDPADRRRLTIALSERGRAAAAAVRAGVEEVDEELAARLSADELHGLLAGLGALAEIRAQAREASSGPDGAEAAAVRAETD
jgi:DNA-binding MarR family transcriptional regulator